MVWMCVGFLPRITKDVGNKTPFNNLELKAKEKHLQIMAYSNEKPGVLTETLGVYSEPRGVQVGRLAGVALYSLRDGISWK